MDATLIAAPSSTKNKCSERDPQMHQAKKGTQWHFGMKVHIGMDAESGRVHSVIGTAANVNDVTPTAALLHGQEKVVFADPGYQRGAKREEARGLDVQWQVRYRGLAKNRARLTMLFALSNLWMARWQILGAQGRARPQPAQTVRAGFKPRLQRAPARVNMAPIDVSRDRRINLDQLPVRGWGLPTLPGGWQTARAGSLLIYEFGCSQSRGAPAHAVTVSVPQGPEDQ